MRLSGFVSQNTIVKNADVVLSGAFFCAVPHVDAAILPACRSSCRDRALESFRNARSWGASFVVWLRIPKVQEGNFRFWLISTGRAGRARAKPPEHLFTPIISKSPFDDPNTAVRILALPFDMHLRRWLA